MIPHTLVLKPGLIIHGVYNVLLAVAVLNLAGGYWYISITRSSPPQA